MLGAPKPSDPRPIVEMQGGHLTEAVEQAAEVLAETLFLRDAQLVGLRHRADIDGEAEGDDRAVEIYTLDADMLRVHLAGGLRIQKPDSRRAGHWREIDPPMDLVRAVLAWAPHGPYRKLHGVVRAPLLRRDGSLIETMGYDAATGLWVACDPALAARIPRSPTRDDAEDAARMLAELVRSFPFVEEADLAVFLSAVLTAIQRPVLPSAPLHGFDSPAPGTGKSMLAGMVSAIAIGARTPALSVSPNEEETGKRIDGILLSGRQIALLDNIETPLGGDKLCSMLTEECISVRPLGGSGMVSVGVTTMFLATGNNLRFKGDLVRRGLVARLDAKTERPEQRQFDSVPVAETLSRRHELVAAALTILRAYQAAGCPARLPPLGSFEGWSRMVREPLVWAGCADPLATMERQRETDPVLADLTALMEAWKVECGATMQMTAGEMIRKRRDEGGLLQEALESIALDRGAVNAKRLGRCLARHKDRIVAGHMIVQSGKRCGSVIWRLATCA